MLIKIQGLPFKTKYQDVKLLVRSECTISDFKLDNLVVDSDGTKKVLVTVGNEAEAICLIKCLNGFRMSNCVLSVESIPTAKAADLDPTAPNTYDQRPATYTQPRTDYPNQGGIEYNRLPHNYGQSTQNMPQRPGEPMRGRNEGWTASNVGGNQWGHNSSANSQGTQGSGFPGTPIYPQHPSIPQRVDSGTYSGNRPQQSTNYGYPPKSNIPTVGSHQPRQDLRSVNLRSVDTSLNNGPPARYPSNYQQDKPITIMKDNFQGPTMYQMGVNSASYPGGGHGAPQVWNQGQEPKGQVYAKSNQPYEKYEDDRRHPQLDKRPDVKSSQEGVRVAVYKDYEKPRQFSPTRRNISGHENMKKRVPSPHVPSTREILARRLESPERKISPMGMAMSGRLSPPIRNMSPPIRRVSPSGRWTSATRPGSPPDRRGSPSSRRVAIRGMIISPSGRTVSSPGRLVSPSRRMSPMSGRAMAANMRVSPSGRRVSPAGRGQGSREGRTSPSGRMASPRMGGRHVSPTERRMSPGDRRILDRRVSPRRMAQKRSSPVRRLESPPPVSVRQETRYSPRHHIDKASDPKLDIDGLKGKQVRPAYEGQASSQAMYSGAYRPNLKENASYAMTGPRQPEQRMSPWRQDRDKNTYSSMKKQDDDRRDVNEKRHPRESHSPIHREHSPIRDHYRAGSPVSRSPRRSWALEKRPYCRSPESREIPPPPTWPGVKTRDEDTYKNKFNRPEDNPKDSLVWERPSMKIEESKRLHEPRVPEEKLRERGMPQRDMARAPYEPNPREPKFTPRHEFEGSRKEEYQRQRDMMRRSPDRREFRDTHPNAHERSPGPPERRHDEYRRPSPRREDGKKAGFHQEFDRDFEDIYKRAQEFRKKAEQMRRSNDRRRDGHSEEVHESHREDKYGRRDRSPHRRPGPERHEPDRHYDEPKYKDREPEWNLKKAPEKPKKTFMPPQVKAKRDKAIDELMGKIMRKYKQITDLPEDQRRRFADELRMALARLLVEMFGDKDVSFIEIVIKYDAKIGGKQEEMMVMDVLKCLPSLYRRGKRPAPEPESSSKMARYSPEAAMKEDSTYTKHDRPEDWDVKVQTQTAAVQKIENLPPPQLVTPRLAVQSYANFAAPADPQQLIASQMLSQMMVPLAMPTMLQFMPTFAPDQFRPAQVGPALESQRDDMHKLFLCKDDFEPFTDTQAQLLKSFLVSQIIKVTETSQGWSPDLILKGINTVHRYEVASRDEASKNWLINLDFSELKMFHILVYTDEELWYERAAIWLPGHSKCRHIEPLDKLKLQNKNLVDVNIGKWKFVKKVMNEKGTRIYVDMPSSSAMALDKYKMMLSYELQKVNVILKAVAVDKNSFDAGLKEFSVINQSMLANAILNSPMPSLMHDSGAVQITLKGNKTISIEEARKLKETVIYHLFRYLQNGGSSLVDFVKYGSFPPSFFGVVPENHETKRWLLSTQFGRVNRQPVIVVGGNDSSMKYFRMYMYLPTNGSLNSSLAIERLRRSNQGVKGINFHLWRPYDRTTTIGQRLDVEIDLESVETLMKLEFRLDYVDDHNDTQTVMLISKLSRRELEATIQMHRDEMTDRYDVANMELESSDDEVICLE